MDIQRQEQSNKLNLRNRDLNKCIEVEENMLESLIIQGDSPYVRAQMEKITTKNNDRKQELELNMTKLNDIISGKADELIIQENKEAREEMEIKTKISAQRKKDIQEKKEDGKKVSQAYYQNTRSSDRQYKNINREISRSYYHFGKACSTIPDYMLRNLSDMPANKGYYWKNVACFGTRARQSNTITIFDKRKGGLLVIHEWTPKIYTVYHKKGRDRKILVSSTIRPKRK